MHIILNICLAATSLSVIAFVFLNASSKFLTTVYSTAILNR